MAEEDFKSEFISEMQLIVHSFLFNTKVAFNTLVQMQHLLTFYCSKITNRGTKLWMAVELRPQLQEMNSFFKSSGKGMAAPWQSGFYEGWFIDYDLTDVTRPTCVSLDIEINIKVSVMPSGCWFVPVGLVQNGRQPSWHKLFFFFFLTLYRIKHSVTFFLSRLQASLIFMV